MYFDGKKLLVENYMTRQTFEGGSDTLKLLGFFSGWKTSSQARRAFSEYTAKSLSDSLQSLLKNGLLIRKGSLEDELSVRFGSEWLWPTASRHYHFSTKLDGQSTTRQMRSYYEKYLKDKKPPHIYKSYPRNEKVRLLPWKGGEAPLFTTLANRHSTRSFTGRPISLSQLSRIVYYTWGRISTYKTPEFGQLLHKTSPSAGARHPIEAYAIINRVYGLDSGIYHYSVKDHSLELLKKGDFRKKCVTLTAGHAWMEKCSVLFIMTAVVARTAWKYRIPRVYRAFLLDAGHLSQSFLLVSTALGLGACCVGTISDLAMEKELGLDGITETVIFAVGVGQSTDAISSLKASERLE
jgi:SagB-type dehydrogenase family enzyme